MPTYAYRCTSCAHEFEVFQKFADAPLSECPECGETIRRVFQPVGIVFKGSGWYVNDNRKGTDTSSERESKSTSTDADSDSKSKSADAKADSSAATPAPKVEKDTPAKPTAAPAKVAAD